MSTARRSAGLLLIGLALLVLYPGPPAAADYPRLRLDNGEIAVSVFLPDARAGYYRGTRFDWSGIIERVDYRGHRFYAPLHANHDPTGHDHVSGPATEFAMFEPMGFAEAAPEESFVKIGVGLLARGTGDAYSFSEKYRLVRAGAWAVGHGPGWVRFEQDLDGPRGWAYRYRKTIRLVPGKPEFVMSQYLENRGRRRIDITHYNHNFTLIDDTPYGPDYRVEFPFAAANPAPIGEHAGFRDHSIIVAEPLGAEESLWAIVFDGHDPGGFNAARVRNLQTGAAVDFEGDARLERMVFWAVERAVCPEPFIRIRLAPGQSREWKTRYRFHAGEVPAE